MDDLEELRHLLLRRDREEVKQLRADLAKARADLEEREKRETRVHKVAEVLAMAFKVSRASGDELTRAIRPTIENSITESIQRQPKLFINSFRPIIAALIRSSIAESFRDLLQTVNQTIHQTFSWQRLKWRWEALRSGKSFAELVVLRSLLFRVEQVFLVHRETGLVIIHSTIDRSITRDSDMVAAMLSAIQDFARDSFKVGEGAGLEEFRIGELQVWIVPGPLAYLAAVIRGEPPRELHTRLEEAVESAHVLHGEELVNFKKDSEAFEPLRPELEACLQARYEGDSGAPKLTAAWIVLAGAAAVLVLGGLRWYQSLANWDAYLRRLSAEQGLAVTTAHQHWFGRSQLEGLRDPLAANPVKIASDFHLDPAQIDFDWKEYLALDPASVRHRFDDRFGSPRDGKMEIKNGVATLSGTVPFEWLERVKAEGGQVPGISSVEAKGVKIYYDPAKLLARFTAKWPLPAGVTARVEHDAVVLSGRAAYEWIEKVRANAADPPRIPMVAEKDLEVIYDPKLVLERVTQQLKLPDDVHPAMNDTTLTLTGEASHATLQRIRAAATEVPGVSLLDDKRVTDLDEQAFKQSKSVIESAFVYFLPSKDDFATEGFAALSRLPDEIRRCDIAARRIGLELTIEIRGQADATGPSEKNTELSRRRAEAVNAFLVQCGLSAEMFKPLAMGAPSAAPETPEIKPAGEQSQRRVAFRVLSQAVSARP